MKEYETIGITVYADIWNYVCEHPELQGMSIETAKGIASAASSSASAQVIRLQQLTPLENLQDG